MVESLYFDRENAKPGTSMYMVVATLVITILVLFTAIRLPLAYAEHTNTKAALAFGVVALDNKHCTYGEVTYVGEVNVRAEGFMDNSNYVVHAFRVADLRCNDRYYKEAVVHIAKNWDPDRPYDAWVQRIEPQ